jgi:hypothetical protein
VQPANTATQSVEPLKKEVKNLTLGKEHELRIEVDFAQTITVKVGIFFISYIIRCLKELLNVLAMNWLLKRDTNFLELNAQYSRGVAQKLRY